jgi:hypothetical protein
MTFKDTEELIDQTREALIEDFRTIYHRDPKNNELFSHIKHIFKEGYQEDILSEVLGDEINCPNDYYKLLMLVASTKK